MTPETDASAFKKPAKSTEEKVEMWLGIIGALITLPGTLFISFFTRNPTILWSCFIFGGSLVVTSLIVGIMRILFSDLRGSS